MERALLKRVELRKMIVNKLLNKTAAGPRVYSGLPFNTANDDCPCILVYASQENGTAPGKHTTLFNTTLTINIEVRVADDYRAAEDSIDSICEQIEMLLLADPELNMAVEAITSLNTQKGWEDGGDHSLSIAIIAMQFEYKRDISVITDGEFLTAHIDVDAIDPADPNIKQPGPDGRIEATAEITVNQ